MKIANLSFAIAVTAGLGLTSAFASPTALLTPNVETNTTPLILAHGGKHKHAHCHKRKHRPGFICHRHWHKRHKHHA